MCDVDASGIATIANLGCVFQNLVGKVLGFVAIVFFVILIIGGFRFITSGGDPKAVDSAKKTISSAIIGLIVIMIAYLVVVLISKLTGVDITTFNVVLQ